MKRQRTLRMLDEVGNVVLAIFVLMMLVAYCGYMFDRLYVMGIAGVMMIVVAFIGKAISNIEKDIREDIESDII